MRNPKEIVHQDKLIALIIETNPTNSAPMLFERYQISGTNRDAFVAALIGRLCLLEARNQLERKGNNQ